MMVFFSRIHLRVKYCYCTLFALVSFESIMLVMLWLLRFIYHSGTRNERERERERERSVQILFSSSRRRGRLAEVWHGITYPRQASRPNSLNLAPGVSSLPFLFFLSETLLPMLSLFILSPFLAKREGYITPYKIICNYAPLFKLLERPRPAFSSSPLSSSPSFLYARRLSLVDRDSSPSTFLSFLRFSSCAHVFTWKFHFVLHCSNQFNYFAVFINVV